MTDEIQHHMETSHGLYDTDTPSDAMEANMLKLKWRWKDNVFKKHMKLDGPLWLCSYRVVSTTGVKKYRYAVVGAVVPK